MGVLPGQRILKNVILHPRKWREAEFLVGQSYCYGGDHFRPQPIVVRFGSHEQRFREAPGQVRLRLKRRAGQMVKVTAEHVVLPASILRLCAAPNTHDLLVRLPLAAVGDEIADEAGLRFRSGKLRDGRDEGRHDRIESQRYCSVVLATTVLAEVEYRLVAFRLRVLHDDGAEDHSVALGPFGIGGIDEVEFPIRRIVDIAALNACVMGAALDVVAGQAVVYLAETQCDARAAKVQVVVVSRILVVAVVMEQAVFDSLIDGPFSSAVPSRHDPHVVVVDVAVANPHVIRLIDAYSGPIVRAVMRLGEFEAFEQASVRSRVELEDRPRRAAFSRVVEALAGNRDPFLSFGRNRSKGQSRLTDEDGRLFVGFAAGERMDEDDIARFGNLIGVLDSRETFSRADFERGGHAGRGNAAEEPCEEASRRGHRDRPFR